MTEVEAPQPAHAARHAWLAEHDGGPGTVLLDDPATAADRLAGLGEGTASVVVLADVLDHLDPDDAGALLGRIARVLADDGRLLVAHRVAGAGDREPRPVSTPGTLVPAVAQHLAPRTLHLDDGDLLLTAVPGAADAVEVARLQAGVHAAAEAAWRETAELAHRRSEELRGLNERLDGLQAAVRGRSVHAKERRRLEQTLRETVEAAEQQLCEVAFQRDDARWKLASMRVRRWNRLGTALGEARRSRKALLLLPLKVWQIVTGPPVPSALPRPTRKKVPLKVPEGLPVVTGMRPRALDPVEPAAVADLRVAGIMDTFTRACFEPEVELLTFTPEGWRDTLEQRPPNLLFVESAWQGNDGSWQYRVGQYDDVLSVGHPELSALTAWCRQRGIPTVFWNKEDPIHFNRFRRASTLFDVVLTTDADCVPEYAKLHLQTADVIEALPFAAQPVLHNPTGNMGPRDPRPVFAGTYYKSRHEERKRSLEQLLDAARPFELMIYDRTHGDGDPSTGFPDRFASHIVGGVPYAEMVRLYGRHKVFLNTNSVVSSPTMFSRRVFELLACGTPVVSTPSLGLEQMLGDVVDVVDTEEAARDAIRRLVEDEDWWRERSLAGLQLVMSQHTYADRLAQVARWCGYDVAADRDAAITALRPASDPAGDADLEVVLTAGDATDGSGAAGGRGGAAGGGGPAGGRGAAADGSVEVRRLTLGSDDEVARYRELADLAPTAWVLVGEGAPGRDEVARLATARRYTRADAIGTDADDGPTHRYVDALRAGPALVRRELVARLGWSSDPTVLARILDEARTSGSLFYAVETAGRAGSAGA
ncbi:glycosyltransferase [Egicoccus sp. AB-alg6-2]|uniref:glycosyltransferase family protein n=1 Tax=Egicoccus sp. AB-alg6-2 TaxID=3242692 RepID=UPI00359F0333